MAILSGRHDWLCSKGPSYSYRLKQAEFESGGVNYDATLRNLELIGEAARYIPESVHAAYSSIPWRQNIATQNRLIPGYLGIDNDTLWSIIQADLAGLLLALQSLKEDQENFR